MTRKLKYKHITWIDLNAPSGDEIAEVAKEYKLHALVSDELSGASIRSKVDIYDDFIYLILHFPSCKISLDNKPSVDKDDDGTQEVDFVIGKDFLITTHYEHVDALDEFAQIFANQLEFGRPSKELHAGHLFYTIIRQIYQSLEERLVYINNDLKSTEKKIFSGYEKEMVTVLADINRNLLDFRWSLKMHREILESLDLAGRDFFGEKFAYFLHAITGSYEKIWNMLESNRDTFTELRQTNESMLTIKTNEIMKFFTVMAFVTLPLTVMTQMFGMNSEYLPIVNHPNGFWIILIMMAVAVAIIFLFFRLKKWL
jgi:magnesium transporter